MAEKTCESCAGKYDDMFPECPYCGSVNYKGAEAQYLDQLEEVRENMENLKEIPAEEMKKEFRRQGRLLAIVFAVTAMVLIFLTAFYLLKQADWDSDRDVKADFLWKQENYSQMDALYEKGDYEALREYFAEEKQNPITDWSHSDFYFRYVKIADLNGLYNLEEGGAVLDAFDYALILQSEWEVLYSHETRMLDEQEREKLEEYIQPVQHRFETRWNMTGTEYEELSRQAEGNYGWISLEICQAYVEKWMESK